ncbi:hypothetical protein AVM02_09490 [Brucella anthropi]|uniref:hypothetical protein n=1 Tax=Brucella anthropi TaxID=529 RepID=UPI0039885FC2
MLLDKNYAHNPPAGSGKVNPFDDSQIITFTFRYLSNNVPQSGKEIVWYVTPRTTDLQFFDAQNAAVNVTSQGNIVTKTDSEGLTVLKIGSLTRFLGTVEAVPSDDTSTMFTPIFHRDRNVHFQRY